MLQGHQDTVAAIEKIHPGQTGVELDTTTCVGKADLVIWYASHDDRVRIEKLLGSDLFFGVPYKLQNR